jgi:predicted transposase/invertase (TIGR01784 family)
MLDLPDIRDTAFFKDAFKQGEKQGEKRGERQSKEAIASRLLAEGIAPKKVAKIVGLPLKDVQRLPQKK